jgi:hypothetical protein
VVSKGPLPLSKDSSLGEWFVDEKGRALLMQYAPPEYAESFGQESSALPGFITNMPFRKLVLFSGGALTEEMIERLVAAAQGTQE